MTGYKKGSIGREVKVLKNGQITPMTYAQVCYELGFDAETEFVDVRPNGKIGWSLGHPEEILSLKKAVQNSPYTGTKTLLEFVR